MALCRNPCARRWALSLLAVVLSVPLACQAAAQEPPIERREASDTVPTLGLDRGLVRFDTPTMHVALVVASQTVAELQPRGASFDFTPSDWLERRQANGFHHLGDLTLRWRTAGSSEWSDASTATARAPVQVLPVAAPVLAAADLDATLPSDLPLEIRRYWELADSTLALRFEISNASAQPVEIGALGIPMVFNNILDGRSLEEAHAVNSFADPYIGRDAGYLQVTRLSGHGPALVVVPYGETPFEAYRPLLTEPTRRGVTFEGFYEWMVFSGAYATDEWRDAEPWNPPTSVVLAPGVTRSYGVRFLLAGGVRDIEATLRANGRPVAVGVPGYVLPMDLDGRLFLGYDAAVASLTVDPDGALTVVPTGIAEQGWRTYHVRGAEWGRARLTVTYEDGAAQSIHYRVIEPQHQVVANLGRFLTTEQWFERPDDPFHRSPSIISYDYETAHQVLEDDRAWIAGLGDEGGSGSWLAAIMKQLMQPEPVELAKIQRFVDGVLWGGLQYATGERKFGVRKSLFYYEPDSMPSGTYGDDVRYGGWASWNREHARRVDRSYNYPHVAAAYWVLYHLARNYDGLVSGHGWEWYLERAHQTATAMMRFAPHYSQFGQMGGTVFLLILLDLQREGWVEQAAALETSMQRRAAVWRSLGYPFGSEMPWDSTGQEEVYAWCTYFGYDEKARVTLDAILGYMPTVPHWGYNGSARRYWDFQYAGKLRRIERQLHHYGSGLNAIPVLAEFRAHPDDLYLLRVGYGGLMGAIANVTQEGFGPSGFHAYPSTLRIDGYSGDYGPGFFGHAINAGTYIARDATFGWLAFGGNIEVDDGAVRVRPLDAARRRVYVGPLGLWLTLDSGTFDMIEVRGGVVRVTLAPATPHGPVARLRVTQAARLAGVGAIVPDGAFPSERGAYLIPLSDETTAVLLRAEP
jgi:hypothetical protein